MKLAALKQRVSGAAAPRNSSAELRRRPRVRESARTRSPRVTDSRQIGAQEVAELRVRLAAAQQKADTLQEPPPLPLYVGFRPLWLRAIAMAQELQSDIAKQRSDLEGEKQQLKQQAVQDVGGIHKRGVSQQQCYRESERAAGRELPSLGLRKKR